jgi:hypothetical protein
MHQGKYLFKRISTNYSVSELTHYQGKLRSREVQRPIVHQRGAQGCVAINEKVP